MNIILRFSFSLTDNYGFSIILLSICVNIVLIPLYLLAEKWQKAERCITKKMKPELDKINEAFSGELKYYYTMAVYRRFNYNPLMAFRVSFGFLIQVPFFMSAYHLLSHLPDLLGINFLFLDDLGTADQLINLAGMNINIMPFIMTVVNILSAYVYTKGLEKKDKIQLWIMAGLFLVLLYNSPSSLLLYWTFNNIFSLFKNIVLYFIENEESPDFLGFIKKEINYNNLKIFYIYLVIISLIFYLLIFHFGYKYSETRFNALNLVYFLMFIVEIYSFIVIFKDKSRNILYKIYKSIIVLTVFAVLFLSFDNCFKINIISTLDIFKKLYIASHLMLIGIMFPAIYINKITDQKETGIIKYNKRIYLLSALYSILMVIVYTPIRLFATSPGDFNKSIFSIVFVLLAIAGLIYSIILAGIFIIPKKKVSSVNYFMVFLAILILVYNTVFIGDFGSLDQFTLSKANNLHTELSGILLEFCVLILIFIGSVFLVKSWRKQLFGFFILMCLIGFVQTSVSIYGIRKINNEAFVSDFSNNNDFVPDYNDELLGFSRNGKNIVVLLLDMFTGGYIQQVLDEEPEIMSNYTGFYWYPNTLSVGYHTTTSLPSINAGFKYLPDEINKRKDDYIVNVISKSYDDLHNKLKDNDFKIARTNPDSYHTPLGSLSSLKKQDILAVFDRDYVNYWVHKNSINVSSDDIENYSSNILLAVSIFKSVPFIIKPFIYNSGRWIFINSDTIKNRAYNHALRSYAFLDLLGELSNSESDGNTFKFFHNFTTHVPYSIDKDGNLTNGYPDPETGNNEEGLSAYYSAKAALRSVSKWITWLKNEELYDNTRIIIVSDHGNEVAINPMMKDSFNIEGLSAKEFTRAHALLLVKDFNNSDKMKIDNRFMSNSDVPSLVASGVLDKNIFGNNFTASDNSFSRELTFTKADTWRWEQVLRNKSINIEFQYSVKNNIFDSKNWKKIK